MVDETISEDIENDSQENDSQVNGQKRHHIEKNMLVKSKLKLII